MCDTASTVLLSDEEAAPLLAARLASEEGQVPWYASIEELVRARSLDSVGVLVIHFRPVPSGVTLAALGRMNVEYPGIQKVAVMEGPLPLPIAEYLTACGVELFWSQEPEEGSDRLPEFVDRMHERIQWIVT